VLHFENTSCVGCGRRVGYIPEADVLTALDREPNEDANWLARAEIGGTYRFCDNAAYDVCNWLFPADAPQSFCAACRHNQLVPDTGDPQNVSRWRQIEYAKHRLIYSLLRLGLPIPAPGDAEEPLVFRFLADAPAQGGPKIMTGHENGIITIALAEADDSEREQRRANMGEPYRTLIGHFRHEVGHYYWDLLVRDGNRLDECRRIFGDDRQDYEAALKRHYENGPPADWADRYISAYATTHPWEDFAESWAHYFHIIDTFEMARALGLSVAPRLDGTEDLAADADLDVYAEADMNLIVERWVPVAFAMNSINRCMGQGDLYPFVLAPPVVEKLAFMHDLIRGAAQNS
jgi:hypothetical protein